MTTADKERNKYERMWDVPAYRNFSPGEKLAREAFREMRMRRGDSLIDFGCGTGRPAREFQRLGAEVTGVDHAVNCIDSNLRGTFPFVHSCLWDLPDDLTADFGYCTDVMEHIPPDMMHDVLEGIRRSISGSVFFQIATFSDAMGKRIGETLHLTVEQPRWWQEALSQHWNDVTIRGNRNCILVAS